MRYVLSAAGLVVLLALVLPVLAAPTLDRSAGSGGELQVIPKLPKKGLPQPGGNPLAPKVVTVATDYEIATSDDLYVRVLSLAMNFDDKGNIIDVTRMPAAEQLKLKGSTPAEQKLPGYKAKTEDLRMNSVVEAYLVKKPAAPTAPKTPEKKDGDAAADTTDTPKTETKAPAPKPPVTVVGAQKVVGKLAAVGPNSITLRAETQTLQYPNAPPKAAPPANPNAPKPFADKVAIVVVIIEQAADPTTKTKTKNKNKNNN